MTKKASDPLVLVQNNATGGVSLWQAQHHQSAADRNGISLADYIHAMFGFLRQAGARRVLMIGCGGGTLASMLHRAGVETVIVDIDPRSLEIARRYFHLPDAVETHAADGLAFVSKETRRFDAIVLDAFDGEGIPRHLLAKRFFDAARARMKTRGALFLMNLIVADDEDPAPARIVAKMRETWGHVRLLDCEGWIDRNAVVAAGAVSKLKRPKLAMPPARGAAKLARGLEALAFRKVRRC
ncbi:MAG TPA: fused MFS/spermidine synthase [Rhizomicrobium sp.]|nr:fused MFS/spermidine synthase [Rhizomicrobium sp.]